MADKAILTITDVAELLCVSRPTVYQLIRRNDFPSFRIGNRTRISRAALDAWIAEQSRSGGQYGSAQ